MSDPALARPSFASWRAGGYANSPLPRRADPASLQDLAGRSMGTTWSLRFDNPAMLPLDAVRAAAQGALDRVVAQMSTWEADSDIARFNRAEAGSRHVLAPEFAEVMACALHWAEASGGAIDPSVGPLAALWGFGAQAAEAATAPEPPSRAAITQARERIGWRALDFDPATRSLRQPGAAALDLSGIAKGFAVDLVLRALQQLGLRDVLVEVGGELRAVGRRPDGMPWQVQVDTVPGAAQRIALEEMAIATSGDRFHFHEHGGRCWSHTLDPRSGEPITHSLAAVSVLHRACMQADALATLLTVLGPDEGPAFARCHGIAALFASRGDEGALRFVATEGWPAPSSSKPPAPFAP